ncbi:slipin family protein [Marinicella meishanensis]|uniref:slipin family protein n=1 Tax=Marinicella meishanensis TaxID=2873263 RepID=UPI001CBFDF93|nr:slipin family protein [Marinicella sp. NBU2979]
MIFRKRIVVADNERALLFRDRQLEAVLTAGVHQFWDFGNRLKVRLFDITATEITQKDVKVLLRNKASLCKEHYTVISTDENEVALIHVDGQFTDLIKPQSEKWFWNTAAKVEVKRINVTEQVEVSVKDMNVLAKAAKASVLSKGLVIKEVVNQQVGLLFIDGQLQRVLKAGKYGFWNFNQSVDVAVVETRAQTMEVAGQEILTKDKVSLRVNLSATFKVTDAVTAVTELANHNDFLYNALQLALRKAIGTQVLDALLADKEAIDTFVRGFVAKKVADFGLTLIEVGVKDIILPGEMKTILNQVVEAEKAAKANIIKRREETAATRSLLNTAKLMDQSDTLRRLKELETLEKVADKVNNITVFGGLEGLTKDNIKLNV